VPEAIKRPQMDLGPYNQGFTESEFLDKFKCATHACISHSQGPSQRVCARLALRQQLQRCDDSRMQRDAHHERSSKADDILTSFCSLSVRKRCTGPWRPRTRC